MLKPRRSEALSERVTGRVTTPTTTEGVITGNPSFNLEHPAYKEAWRGILRIAEDYELNRSEVLMLCQALLIDAADRVLCTELPASAPELWTERRGTKENPVTFVRRVYADWLGKGLKRSHLLSLDKPLYTALGVWLHRHPEEGFPELDA